jgi:putative transposase
MKSENILCKIRRSFKKTTDSSHFLVRYPNLIKEIIPLRVNEIWHADITYIRLRASFAYLAALIDGYSRKVVGYAPGKDTFCRACCAGTSGRAIKQEYQWWANSPF